MEHCATEMVIDRLSGMIRKQNTCYSCHDYLKSDISFLTEKDINVEGLRRQICEWSFSVVDYFNFERELVSVSLSYLDRYLSKSHRWRDTIRVQLAAVTSLYLAIKLYGIRKVSLSLFVKLSKGRFSMDHILAMEGVILEDLSWKVHPPTTLSFVNHFLVVLNSESEISAMKHRVNEISRFLTELSAMEYAFVSLKPSSIALACILNAMDKLRVSKQAVRSFTEKILERVLLDTGDEEVKECQEMLNILYSSSFSSGSDPFEIACDQISDQGSSRGDITPVSVAQIYT